MFTASSVNWLNSRIFFPLFLVGLAEVVFGELGEGKGKMGIYIKESFKLEKTLKFPINVLT